MTRCCSGWAWYQSAQRVAPGQAVKPAGTPWGRRRRIGAPPPKTMPWTSCVDPPAARNQRGWTGRPQVVAGVRPAKSLIRLVTSLIPRPIRMNSTPMAMAMAATP